MTMHEAVAHVLGHHDFSLRGDGAIVLDGPIDEPAVVLPPLAPEDLAAAEAAIEADPAALAAYAAAVRFAVETGGITVLGVTVDTSRESQAMITGAHAFALATPAAVISYKSAGGFVTLDAATMVAVAPAVGQHVQACFAREAEVATAIAAETVTSRAAIDAAFADVTTPWAP